MSNKEVYDSSSIKVLKGLDGVRKRPAMYIGDTGQSGYTHLVQEALDNSVDEAVAGHCNEISLEFKPDQTVTVTDNGRGIPVGKHPTEGIPTIDVVMTMLHAGAKFGGESSPFRTSGGLHGVGISVVNALSEWMEVIVCRDGGKWFRRYERGNPTEPDLKLLGKSSHTGTQVTFKPDPKVFKDCEYVKSTMVRRLRELAFLNAGLKLVLNWEEDGTVEEFRSENGLADYIAYFTASKKLLHKPILLSGSDIQGCEVNLAFVYDDGYEDAINSFTNNINTIDGGIHYNAALDSLCKVITELAYNYNMMKGLKVEPAKSDIMEGLTLLVSVRVPEPQFVGQTKTKLENQDLRAPFGDWMRENIKQALLADKEIGKIVAQKVIDAIRARDAARKAKELSRNKNVIQSLTLPGKLVDCSSKDPTLCELYIVEGDCFAPDTLIHTKNGLKRLDEIQDGELVYTHMHRYRSAIRRKPKVKLRKCRITIQGRSFVCSEDHLFLVLRVGENDEQWTEWVPCREIQITDLLVKTFVEDGRYVDFSKVLRQVGHSPASADGD